MKNKLDYWQRITWFGVRSGKGQSKGDVCAGFCQVGVGQQGLDDNSAHGMANEHNLARRNCWVEGENVGDGRVQEQGLAVDIIEAESSQLLEYDGLKNYF